MTTQELAYTEIERLVKSFKDMPASQRKGMNEMQTRLGYILPLFRALGWDTSNINEVSPEEKVSRGWISPFVSGMCRVISLRPKEQMKI